MKQLLLLSCIVLSSFYVYANEVWECTSTRKNTTIITLASYEDTAKTQKVQDAFLKKLINELDLDDLPYSTLISFNNSNYSQFFIDKAGNVQTRWLPASTFSSISFKEGKKLEIYFENDWEDSTYNYDRIFTLVKYAIGHVDQIKLNQKEISWNYDGNLISITTIDTNLIKSIPTEPFNFNPEKALKRRNIALPISLFAAFMGAFIAIFAGQNAKRKNAKT